MSNRSKIGHFVFWLYHFIITLLFPRLFLPKGYKKDWMSWKQYKGMTGNLNRKLFISNQL